MQILKEKIVRYETDGSIVKGYDAGELIRCKDCKWYDMTDAGGTFEPIVYRCRRVSRLWREPHDFCSKAEREEE